MKPKKKPKLVPKPKRVARLKKKCDKALQDYYRALKLKCEACGKVATVMHHHCPVSRSNFLRYDGKNLVPLCQGCHMRHHNGEPGISYRYRKYIDEDYLMENQHTYKKWTEEELEDIKKSFKT